MIKRGIKHLSRVGDVLFRKLRIERDITVYEDDVFLTSYPRSGNTWMRFLVGNLVHPDEPVTFLNLERLLPDMYIHSDREMRKMRLPRVIKSHECFDPRYKRIVYIVRDPETSLSRTIFGSSRRDLSLMVFRCRSLFRSGWPRSIGLDLVAGEITSRVG